MYTAVIAGLVFLAFYVQRAIQGSVFGTSQSIGLQFDPRDGYVEGAQVGMTETVTLQTGWPMFSANILPTYERDEDLSGGEAHPDWIHSSLPNGPVPREPAFYVGQQVTADWSSNRSATYDDLREP